MKRMLKNITTSILAMVAAGMLVQSASAATLGDLYVAFRSGDSSQTNDLVIDLGVYSNFTAGSTSTINIGDQLAAAFGANWASDQSITFSVFGAVQASAKNGAVAYTLWTSVPNGGTVLNATGKTTLSGADSSIAGVANASGPGVVAKGNTDSYTTKILASGSQYFKAGQQETSVVDAVGGVNGDADLTVYQYAPTGNTTGTVTQMAGFDLQTDGTFAAVASVPEPSTYALIILGASVLFWNMKRRNVRLV